jgi:hypothetical protein
MKYARKDAKAYTRANMKGIWAAALTPFTQSLAIDKDGFRENIRALDTGSRHRRLVHRRQAGRVLLDVGR